MPLKRLSLRFDKPYAHLEAPFKQQYIRASMKHTRVSLVLGILLFASFGLLDGYLMPQQKHLTWFIRFAIMCPVVLAVVGLTYVRSVENWFQPLLAALIVFCGGGIIAMILVAPPPVNYFYYAGVILVFVFAYTYIRVGFYLGFGGLLDPGHFV